jgi:hypothetical protein
MDIDLFWFIYFSRKIIIISQNYSQCPIMISDIYKNLYSIFQMLLTIVCLTMALYTISYLNNGWGHQLSLIELLLYRSTFVSRRFNVLCVMFKSIAFFMKTLFVHIYVRVDSLLICGMHLQNRIISLRFGPIQLSRKVSGHVFMCGL